MKITTALELIWSEYGLTITTMMGFIAAITVFIAGMIFCHNNQYVIGLILLNAGPLVCLLAAFLIGVLYCD